MDKTNGPLVRSGDAEWQKNQAGFVYNSQMVILAL